MLTYPATDRVPEYLQAADLCIFPSDYEGFGVGLIEALATGTPVVSTPVGVARELVRHGETGFVFPIRDCRCHGGRHRNRVGRAQRRGPRSAVAHARRSNRTSSIAS